MGVSKNRGNRVGTCQVVNIYFMVLNLDQYKIHCQSYFVQIKIRRKQPRDDNIFCIMHLCQGRGSFDPCISSKASGGRVREPMQSVNDS